MVLNTDKAAYLALPKALYVYFIKEKFPRDSFIFDPLCAEFEKMFDLSGKKLKKAMKNIKNRGKGHLPLISYPGSALRLLVMVVLSKHTQDEENISRDILVSKVQMAQKEVLKEYKRAPKPMGKIDVQARIQALVNTGAIIQEKRKQMRLHRVYEWENNDVENTLREMRDILFHLYNFKKYGAGNPRNIDIETYGSLGGFPEKYFENEGSLEFFEKKALPLLGELANYTRQIQDKMILVSDHMKGKDITAVSAREQANIRRAMATGKKLKTPTQVGYGALSRQELEYLGKTLHGATKEEVGQIMAAFVNADEPLIFKKKVDLGNIDVVKTKLCNSVLYSRVREFYGFSEEEIEGRCKKGVEEIQKHGLRVMKLVLSGFDNTGFVGEDFVEIFCARDLIKKAVEDTGFREKLFYDISGVVKNCGISGKIKKKYIEIESLGERNIRVIPKIWAPAFKELGLVPKDPCVYYMKEDEFERRKRMEVPGIYTEDLIPYSIKGYFARVLKDREDIDEVELGFKDIVELLMKVNMDLKKELLEDEYFKMVCKGIFYSMVLGEELTSKVEGWKQKEVDAWLFKPGPRARDRRALLDAMRVEADDAIKQAKELSDNYELRKIYAEVFDYLIDERIKMEEKQEKK